MNISLLSNIFTGVYESKEYFKLSIIFILFICQGYVVSLVSYYNFDMMNNIDNKDRVLSCIYNICILWIIRQIVWHIAFITLERLKIILQEFLTRKYLTILIQQSNIDWLNIKHTSNIYSSVQDGVGALLQTMQFFIKVFDPIIQTIGNLCVIYSFIGFDIIYVVTCFSFLFALGLIMLRWDFLKREQINIDSNPLSNYNVNLSNNFLVHRLNGKSSLVINKIIKNFIYKIKHNVDITSKVQYGYSINEIIGCLFIYAIISHLSNSLTIPLIIASYRAIVTGIDRIWWLFHMFNNSSKNASEWGSLKKLLHEFIPENEAVEKNQLFEYTILGKKYDEYQIIGESGKGKSTWMKQELIHLYRRYVNKWIYFEQNMVIPKSKIITIRDFLDDENYHYDETHVFNWSSMLNLNSIINYNTYNKPFKNPSGGEIKRIIILKKILPIVLYKRNVKILFCDEITAGLDAKNQMSVRKLLNILKNNFGIVIVNIDHHDINEENILKLNVNITNKKITVPKKEELVQTCCIDFGYTSLKNNDNDYLPSIIDVSL